MRMTRSHTLWIVIVSILAAIVLFIARAKVAGAWYVMLIADPALFAGCAQTETPRPPQGPNDFGDLGYGGPAPPKGKPHRYFFKLYALDSPLALKPGATKAELLKMMEGHVLGHGELMGRYQR